MCVCVCVCVCLYIERETDTDRQTERKRERERERMDHIGNTYCCKIWTRVTKVQILDYVISILLSGKTFRKVKNQTILLPTF